MIHLTISRTLRGAPGLGLLLAGLALAGCPASKAEDPARPGAPEKPATEAAAETETREEAPADEADHDPEAALQDPSKATLTAPDTFTVKLDTTEGDILLDVHRDWAPHGADRFYNLVKAGYYEDVAFFRVIGGFMAQAGISGDPDLNRVWRNARIPDDPVKKSNEPGFVSFASAGPNSRTTQFFINFADNSRLDGMGFPPFAKVRDASMEVVHKLHAGYGEGAPRGEGPSQGRLQKEGNAYLKKAFPKLDYIEEATIVEE